MVNRHLLPWLLSVYSVCMGVVWAGPNERFASRHVARPVVVAHRGASALAPENTLAAIRLASEVGATAVEFDVHASADGVPVVIHDKTLARTTNGRGLVRNQTASQLQMLSAGAWFSEKYRREHVPTLEQVFGVVDAAILLCIEIKTGTPIMERVAKDIRNAKLEDRVIIFSFKPKQIAASKQHLPHVPALLLVDPGPESRYRFGPIVEKARLVGADLIGLDHTAMNHALIGRLQDDGFPVFVYTVNEHPDVERAVAFGVDGIISNHPRATMSRVHRLRPTLK